MTVSSEYPCIIFFGEKSESELMDQVERPFKVALAKLGLVESKV